MATFLWHHSGCINSEPLPDNVQYILDGVLPFVVNYLIATTLLQEHKSSSDTTLAFQLLPLKLTLQSKASLPSHSVDTLNNGKLKLFLIGQQNSNHSLTVVQNLHVQ